MASLNLSLTLNTPLLPYLYLSLPPLIILNLLRKRYLSPFRDIPGPFLASISRSWEICIVATTTHSEMVHIAAYEKYGPVIRVAPNELSFSSRITAREILSAGKRFQETDFYTVFTPKSNPDISTEINESVHASKKRVAAQPYSLAAMKEFLPFVDPIITLLFTKLDELFTKEGEGIDLGEWLHFFALDVLGEVAFGRRFGFLEAGTDMEGMIATINRGEEAPLLNRLAWGEVKKQQSGAYEKTHTDLLDKLLKGHEFDPDRFGVGDVFAVAYARLKEVWRMRPPVGLAMGRVAKATIDGVRYEEGTGLAVNGWVVHRDKAVFGEDADVHRPKRWLENQERARVTDRLMVHFRRWMWQGQERMTQMNWRSLMFRWSWRYGEGNEI
ncbi:cytochrome P450 [Halenospora varia]|nr:cytochrome P450 [Halenospora varia]